jgi:energy-coupling factor transporter ATP-binding protein EcfA2
MAYQFADAVDRQTADDCCRHIVARLNACRAGLIIGPHGSGKTTLLHSLGPWLSEVYGEIVRVQLSAPVSVGVWARVRDATRNARFIRQQQQGLPHRGLLIVDGAEQLRWGAWTRLVRSVRRRRQTLLATSHAPLPGATILWETRLSAELVQSLTLALLRNASPQVIRVVQGELAKQDWGRGSNLRDWWFDLYDAVQPYLAPSLARH